MLSFEQSNENTSRPNCEDMVNSTGCVELEVSKLAQSEFDYGRKLAFWEFVVYSYNMEKNAF